MTPKEENIVNIAMMAAELLKDGKIDYSDIDGHVGLSAYIVAMSDAFERLHSDTDWNSPNAPDYWETIDCFAAQLLLEHYAVENVPERQPLEVKVIIDSGVTEAVLKNQDLPVTVEVVDVDPDYGDYEPLKAYRDQLYASYQPCEYTVARFDPPEPTMDSTQGHTHAAPGPVAVYAVGGSVEREIFFGTLDACIAFGEEHNWTYVDENEFHWRLICLDSREYPIHYDDAITFYSEIAGINIENEFVCQHAQELVYCYENQKTLIDFDCWTRYEDVLREAISFEEYSYLDAIYQGDPMELNETSLSDITFLKIRLSEFRGPTEVLYHIHDRKDAADIQFLSDGETIARQTVSKNSEEYANLESIAQARAAQLAEERKDFTSDKASRRAPLVSQIKNALHRHSSVTKGKDARAPDHGTDPHRLE